MRFYVYMNSVRCESSKIEAAKHPTHSFQPGKLTSNTEVLQDLVLSSYSKDLIFFFFFSPLEILKQIFALYFQSVTSLKTVIGFHAMNLGYFRRIN